MSVLFGVIIGLIILVLLVVLHELGHAIAARKRGVVVEEFGIGFPPRAWGKKLKNGIEFTVNWLPLGGFVKLQGEHDAATKKGDYGAASFWDKTLILLAGVGINWLTAVVLLSILAVTGLPQLLPNQFRMDGDTKEVLGPVQVVQVGDNTPAKKAGLEAGDRIIRLGDDTLAETSMLSDLTRESRGKTVEIVYERDGEQRTTQATLNETSGSEGYLGVSSGQAVTLKSTWSAPIVGFMTTVQLTTETLKGLGTLVADLVVGLVSQLSGNEQTREEGGKNLSAAGDSVAGPIGILGVIFPAASEAGLTQLVFLTAIISLTLAVMNVLPIPALDGGRWFTMAIFRVLDKLWGVKLTKEREENIQTVGFLALMALIVLVTIADIGKFL